MLHTTTVAAGPLTQSTLTSQPRGLPTMQLLPHLRQFLGEPHLSLLVLATSHLFEPPPSNLSSIHHTPHQVYGTVHRKGNNNSTSRITVFGKSTSLSVNFWQLSTARELVTVTVWRLTVLHLHTCTGIYTLNRSVGEDATTPETMSNATVTVRYVDNGQIRRQGVPGVALQNPEG